ncbi:MAG TPA: hypothetical protein DF383_02580, partial [Deltaproteobacteria bacterium]|nr:hypothetical protein [Deltaproteobacteria bacterium]
MKLILIGIVSLAPVAAILHSAHRLTEGIQGFGGALLGFSAWMFGTAMVRQVAPPRIVTGRAFQRLRKAIIETPSDMGTRAVLLDLLKEEDIPQGQTMALARKLADTEDPKQRAKFSQMLKIEQKTIEERIRIQCPSEPDLKLEWRDGYIYRASLSNPAALGELFNSEAGLLLHELSIFSETRVPVEFFDSPYL